MSKNDSAYDYGYGQGYLEGHYDGYDKGYYKGYEDCSKDSDTRLKTLYAEYLELNARIDVLERRLGILGD